MSAKFLSHPHIPHEKVLLCAVGEGNAKIKYALEKMGVSVLTIPAHPVFDTRVANHADMQLHDMGQGRVAMTKGSGHIASELKRLGFSVYEEDISAKYPGDIALNCFVLGRYLYCNIKNTGEILLNYYQSCGVEAINVKQGYAKCSTCIVEQNSIITADVSIAKAAKLHGADVLVIQSGGILLNGYDTGFIGGCCGLIAPDKLAFTGRISEHPDYIRIRDFCLHHGVEIVELTDLPLIDIGGIIPLSVV